ncbi:hypothetical protein E5P55_00905 [Candidatus Pinguicoccus supinus]|uniref:50S ribosomal protein L23 n=1 Tax=Candidatus Pinguicoccus supinus TaxID=2529394 RepID=A0A7T0BRQ2_9BACT|nr:hypothetical protein E5P55_00905 [Candidatus Pinguicoccus supinus]
MKYNLELIKSFPRINYIIRIKVRSKKTNLINFFKYVFREKCKINTSWSKTKSKFKKIFIKFNNNKELNLYKFEMA